MTLAVGARRVRGGGGRLGFLEGLWGMGVYFKEDGVGMGAQNIIFREDGVYFRCTYR